MENSNSEQQKRVLLTREKGRKFLEELKAKGPDLSKVGKVTVRLLKTHSKDKPDVSEQPVPTPQELKEGDIEMNEDSSLSHSRQWQQLRNEIIKERSVLNDLFVKQKKSSTEKIIALAYKFLRQVANQVKAVFKMTNSGKV